MKNKKIMSEFLNSLNKNKKLTKFFKIIFNYQELYDYNYISRIINHKDYVILDIYDNVLKNRFNRYIFDFKNNDYVLKINDDDDVIVSYICIKNITNPENNLLKFGYLFKLGNNEMIEFANTFLTNDIVDILNSVIKK